MKKIYFLLISLVITATCAFAQEEPVTDIFAAGTNIDNQTVTMPSKGSKFFVIHHRFSKIKEVTDLYGIYGASNIRLGLDYGVTNKISVGVGLEKYSMMYEFHGKYALLQQTPGKMPVSAIFYGSAVIDSRKKDIFGMDYKFADRMAYFGQLIIARKLTEKASIQIAPSYSHFNKVDSVYQNDAFGINVGGRIKVHNEISLICEYNQGIYVKELRYFQEQPKPSIGLGLEFGTPTHAFQVFATSYDQITNQKNYVMNKNDFTDSKSRGIMLGFNITARL